MTIISIQNIIELNHILEEKGLTFRIHLRDCCGGQSLYMESINKASEEDALEEMQHEVCEYFQKRNLKVQFDKDGLSLIINK